MTEQHAPVAGWYDDPEMALRLRWWDGERWSRHTRPKPVVETLVEAPASASAVGAQTATTGSTVIAAPAAPEPYIYSAPYSWSPGTVSPGSVSPASPALGTPASAPNPLGTFGVRAQRPDELWNTTASSIDYAPERTTTPAAWALAVTPLVTVVAQTAAIVLSGFESTPWIWIAGATIIPVLWIIMWVRRDRITLHEWGHLRRAHWAWAFLGALGYLTARTIVVRRQAAGRGWWPLLTNLAITAVLVNVGLFTPVYDLLRDAIL
ncbi:DUF2510 domain-containing protein [Microcella sp.]|uniref:DUF2510 domain-containing protein n=1 Tax=Microcella sp. TaxID=1913979 RepID=UPI003F710188